MQARSGASKDDDDEDEKQKNPRNNYRLRLPGRDEQGQEDCLVLLLSDIFAALAVCLSGELSSRISQ